MDSEDELLCVLGAVMIRRKKDYEKEEKTQGMGFSRFTEKESNMVYHI